MNSVFPGFDPPAASFDEPLEMLSACHERIEAMLRILDRLPAHLRAHGADKEARAAAARVLRYFDQAGPKHHADEETDLFPLLEAKGALPQLLPVLRREHRAMEAAYARLRPGLEQLATGAGGELSQPLAAEFCALYRAHIAGETAQLLPAAEQLLQPGERCRLGRAMAERRRTG